MASIMLSQLSAGVSGATTASIVAVQTVNGVNSDVLLPVPVPGVLPSGLSATTGSVLSAASMLTCAIVRSGPTAAFTDTTDTAANILATLPGAVENAGYDLTISNTTDYAQTIAAGTGVTLIGDAVVAPLNSARWRVSVSVAGSSPSITMTLLTAAAVGSFNGRNGLVTLASSDVTGALGFTPYNSSNPAAYLAASGNLAGLADVATAQSNLGLGALATLGYPSVGIVYSSGTALSPLTIGTGLSLTGSTLSATGTSGGGSSYNVATPANGASLTVGTYAGYFYTQQINPTETVTSLTITLPATPPDGQRLTVASNASMSGIVLLPNSSQTLGPNMPTAINAGTGFTLQIQAGVWERVQ